MKANSATRLIIVPEPHIKRTGPRKVGGEGEIEIFCADEQSDCSIDVSKCRQLVEEILRTQGVRGSVELTLMFVPESTIAGLNEQYMNKAGSTDVLAFPLDVVEAMHSPGPSAISRGPERPSLDLGDLPILLGDVIVCPAVANRQAQQHAGNFEDEIALLICHGVLHVLGFDHDTEEKANIMQRRERELLELHHWQATMPESFRKVYEL